MCQKLTGNTEVLQDQHLEKLQQIQEVKIQLSNQALEHQSNKEAILERIRVVKEKTERSHANKELLTEKYNKKQVYLKEMQLKIKNLS